MNEKKLRLDIASSQLTFCKLQIERADDYPDHYGPDWATPYRVQAQLLELEVRMRLNDEEVSNGK